MSARKNLFARILPLLMSLPLVFHGQSHALDAPSNDYSLDERAPYGAEAARTVVGRMFGVAGETSDIKYFELELTAHSPQNSAVRSMIVPGWGQYFNKQPVKGSVLFLCTVGSAFASVEVYGKSRHSFNDYKARGSKDHSLYDNYSSQRTHAFLLGAAAAVLWIATAVDAYKNAYTPLYSKSSGVELAFSEDEAVFFLKKSF